MRVFASLAVLSGLLPALALGAAEFINPPPFGEVGDFSNNPVYPVGATVHLQWTATTRNLPFSVALYQLNGTQFMNPFELITKDSVNITDFTWIVGTAKNLTFSSLFFMSIFEMGQTESETNSHYINITSTDTSDSQPSPTVSNPTKGEAVSPSIPTATSTPPSSPSSSLPPSDTTSTGGLTTGAKIGLGVGVASALALGIIAGWLVFGQLRRRQKDGSSTSSMDSKKPYGAELYAPPPIVEIGQPRRELPKPFGHDRKLVEAPAAEPVPVRYELHA